MKSNLLPIVWYQALYITKVLNQTDLHPSTSLSQAKVLINLLSFRSTSLYTSISLRDYLQSRNERHSPIPLQHLPLPLILWPLNPHPRAHLHTTPPKRQRISQPHLPPSSFNLFRTIRRNPRIRLRIRPLP